jgi:CheY-like chemotaxis protein/HPt (histidine-containing phosphotransfer) domain-containing protein
MILIADDHPVNQKLLAITTDKLGYPSVLAGDGLEAVEKALAHPVSLVFMDLQMPRMNGCEAAAQLRERGFDKPIIAVTAGVFEDEWERCRRAGINDMLLKPFKRPDIQAMLEKWLSGFAIPVEGADIVPATKNRAELLGLEEGGGEAAPLPAASGAAASGEEDGVFSPAEVMDTFLDNEEMAFSLLRHFLERTERQIEEFPALPAAGDWENARREAHTIKGAAFTLSGRALGKAAARLEGACKSVDRPEADAAYIQVKEAFARFGEEAGKFMESRKPPLKKVRLSQ